MDSNSGRDGAFLHGGTYESGKVLPHPVSVKNWRITIESGRLIHMKGGVFRDTLTLSHCESKNVMLGLGQAASSEMKRWRPTGCLKNSKTKYVEMQKSR